MTNSANATRRPAHSAETECVRHEGSYADLYKICTQNEHKGIYIYIYIFLIQLNVCSAFNGTQNKHAVVSCSSFKTVQFSYERVTRLFVLRFQMTSLSGQQVDKE